MRVSWRGYGDTHLTCEMHKRHRDVMAEVYGSNYAIQGYNWPAGFRLP